MPQKPKIDPGQIQRMAACGCTDAEIAYILQISEAHLRRRYRQALDQGRARLRLSLRRKQLQLARKGSVPMLIWLGKQYLGQSDRQVVHQAQRVEVVEEVVFPDPQERGDGQHDGVVTEGVRPADTPAGRVCAE